jgi:hypothetical protein
LWARFPPPAPNDDTGRIAPILEYYVEGLHDAMKKMAKHKR